MNIKIRLDKDIGVRSHKRLFLFLPEILLARTKINFRCRLQYVAYRINPLNPQKLFIDRPKKGWDIAKIYGLQTKRICGHYTTYTLSFKNWLPNEFFPQGSGIYSTTQPIALSPKGFTLDLSNLSVSSSC